MVIKKLNSIFHRHSKWLFGLFTIVIIFAFMDFLTPGGQMGCNAFNEPGEQAIGVAFGEDVTVNELQKQAQMLSLAPMIMYGFSGKEPDIKQAFDTICIVRAAEKLGITVSDNDVANFIATSPRFLSDGKFDVNKYKLMIENMKRQGISEELVNDSIRNMVLLYGKLEQSLTHASTVTTGEVQELYRQQNTVFNACVAKFTENDFLNKTKLSKDELEKYFKENNDKYIVEGKLSALVAEIKYDAFKKDAKKLANDASLRKYFERNIASFSTKDAKEKVKFENVKAKVKEAFITAEAKEIAGRKMYDFATKVFDKLNESDKAKTTDFREIAKANNIKVIESNYIKFSEAGNKEFSSAELIRQLKGVANSNPITNVVLAKDAAYVGFLIERIETVPAKLADVRAKVLPEFRKYLALKEARKAADDAADKLATIKNSSERIKAFNAMKDCKFENVEFTLAKPLDSKLVGIEMPLMKLVQGETTPAVKSIDGSNIALLQKRTLPNMDGFKAQEEQLTQQAQWLKRRVALEKFQRMISSECRFDMPTEQVQP